MGSSEFGGLTPEMMTAEGTTTNTVVRWERFLPKMVLRVLLVESDDSTRQIVTAILRKCNYKVAAVSDGLKAWEVLKRRPHSIDLILTEVELPSISGFALLTLIMEHQVCKNIPVIMMSANDSVSTVYKCMLRGAADFLVKPVRKNELKNLWQHVWRRQVSASGGSGADEESDAQQQVEAIAENNGTSNHSSGYVERNMECVEKGNDAQSSCTKPNVEAEGTHMEQGKDVPWAKYLSSDVETQEYKKTSKRSRTQKNEDAEGEKADTSAQENDRVMDVRWDCVNDFFADANLATHNPSREAIDLIGSFDNYPYRSSLNHEVDHPSPVLHLSLRRSHPGSSVNQFSEERHNLKQSDASAFSPYINRTQPPLPTGSAGICNHQKDYETNYDKPLLKKTVGYNFDRLGSCQENIMSQQGKAESQSQLVYSVPIVRCENPGVSYGPPMMQSAGGHQEIKGNRCYMSNPETRSSSQELEQREKREGRNVEMLEEDYSGSSSFCNGYSGRLNMSSKGSGSDGHLNLVSDGHRSTQREAALNKFRLKRKERCYGKKVRYESRKKLAEQRPRVKGQFVRQVQTSNPSPMEA